MNAILTLIQFSLYTLAVWVQRSLTVCSHTRRTDVWEAGELSYDIIL